MTKKKIKETIDGEFFPSRKSKHKVTVIGIAHDVPINRRKVEDFFILLVKGRATVKIVTYKNAVIDTTPSKSTKRK